MATNGALVRKQWDPNVAAADLSARSKRAYAKSYEKFVGPAGQALRNVSTDIGRVSDVLTNSLSDFSDDIRKALEPISDFMGSTLGTLTGVLKDPIGTNGLGNVATNLLNNVSPGLGNNINGSITNLNLQNLVNLPSQLFSSVDHLITAVDNILAIPLSLLAEVYYGYMEIMKSISKLLSNLMNAFSEFLLDFLDSIIPVKAILDLLSQVSILANQIGGIATTFLGVNQISQFTNQVINFSSQIGGILNNPLEFGLSILPQQINQQVSQVLYNVQNPQQFINAALPPQLSQAFATISSMTGFGFNGNMGYGFQSVLEGLQGGVVRSVLSKYASQYNVLAPLLAGSGSGLPQSYRPDLLNGVYSPGGLQNEARRGNNPQQYPVGP
jgi:hypothetical protein